MIGWPVAHSRSPAMHTAALRETGLDGDWSYEALEIAPEDFADRVHALPGEGFAGANVTVPHKERALALAGEVSDRAAAIGAVNTLSFAEGVTRADNTDAPGLIAALGGPVDGRTALVLGAGGSARASVWALLDEGASVTVWNRTPERAAGLAAAMGASAVAAGDPPPVAAHEIVVNATSAGLGAGAGELEALAIDPGEIGPQHTVVELPYGDRETEFVAAARERGARVIDGLEILVRQGAESFRIWTGVEAPVEAMRAAVR